MFKNSASDLVKYNAILVVNFEKRQLEIIKGYHEGITNHKGTKETSLQVVKLVKLINPKPGETKIYNNPDTYKTHRNP